MDSTTTIKLAQGALGFYYLDTHRPHQLPRRRLVHGATTVVAVMLCLGCNLFRLMYGIDVAIASNKEAGYVLIHQVGW